MKKQPFLLLRMIVVSSVLMACLGAYVKYEILKPLELYQDKNIMELPFLLLADDGLRYSIKVKAKAAETAATEPEEIILQTEPVATQPPATEPPVTEPVVTAPPVTEPPVTEPPVTEPPATEPPNPVVEESWFDDALFIGDSRTVGLRDYARLGKAEYFASVGMTVFSAFEDWCNDQEYGWLQLEPLLEKRSYGKVFIALGLNDCGYEDAIIMASMQELIELIQKYQPDAKIIIHGIITVSREKEKEAWYFGIDNLYQLNEGLEQLADGENIFYLDANGWLADEEGYLPRELSGDGCHFYVDGYQAWANWIKENVGIFGIP